MWGHAGAALEESREMVRTHVHHGTELHEPKVSLQIRLDVLHHASEPVHGQVAPGPIRHGSCHTQAREPAPGWFYARGGHLIHAWTRVAVVPSTLVMASLNRFRRNKRARCTRDFTLLTLRPETFAILRFDRPSTSRSTSTVR